MSPSLGWLQAFLSAAYHLDYELAAADLGLNGKQVQRRVHKLEIWLHKVLILDNPTELNEGDGLAFIPIAWEALQSFEAACPAAQGLIIGTSSNPLAKHISKIDLADLARFLAVCEENSYKGAAHRLKIDTTGIQRSVKALERAVGQSLFSGWSILKVTESGDRLRKSARFIVNSLKEFRAVIPDDYDPMASKAHNALTLLKIRQTRLTFLAESILRTGKKQRGTVRLEGVQQALKVVSMAISAIEKEYGSPRPRLAQDIDMSGVTALPKVQDPNR